MKNLTYCILYLFFIFSMCGCNFIDSDENISDSITNTIVSETISNYMDDIDMYEDGSTSKKQEIHIFSNQNNTELLTVTDKDILISHTEYIAHLFANISLHRNDISSLPSNAAAIYTYKYYQEDIDSKLPLEKQPLSLIYHSVLYKADDKYFLSLEFSDDSLNTLLPNKYSYISIDDTDAQFLINLAEGNFDAIKNAKTFSEDEENNFDLDNDADEYAKYMSNITYDDIASVSKKQKIEIFSESKKCVTYSTTDLKEIFKILQAEQPADWKHITSLPSDSKKLCDIIRYAQRRHTIKKVLDEQYRDTIYINNNSYYIFSGSYYYEIPADAGKYFSSLSK